METSRPTPPSDTETGNPRPFLWLSFVATVSLFVVAIGGGAFSIRNIQSSLDQVVDTHNAQSEAMNAMRTYSQARAVLLYEMAAADDPFERDEKFLRMNEAGSEFLAQRARLMEVGLDAGELELMEQQSRKSGEAGREQYHVVELLNEGRHDEALRHLIERAIPAQEEAFAVMDAFIRLQRDQGAEARKSAHEGLVTAFTLMVPATVVAILLSGWVTRFVIIKIEGTMNELQDEVLQRRVTESRLVESEARLRQARDRLESEVAQRTEELRSANLQLRQLASHDNLTGLPNRLLFNELLEQAVKHASRTQQQLAVLFMDLDGFKMVNDTLGHEAGDRLLCEVAKRLKRALRAEDVVARLGGDEFTALIAGLSDASPIEAVCDKLIAAVAEPIMLEGQECRVGVSIGVSLYPEHAEDRCDLLKVADAAMYGVKTSGKGAFLLGAALDA